MGGSHGNLGYCPCLLILLQATFPMLGLRWLRDASMLMMLSLACPPVAACCCCAALRSSGNSGSLCTCCCVICLLDSIFGVNWESTDVMLGGLLLHEQCQRRHMSNPKSCWKGESALQYLSVLWSIGPVRHTLPVVSLALMLSVRVHAGACRYENVTRQCKFVVL